MPPPPPPPPPPVGPPSFSRTLSQPPSLPPSQPSSGPLHPSLANGLPDPNDITSAIREDSSTTFATNPRLALSRPMSRAGSRSGIMHPNPSGGTNNFASYGTIDGLKAYDSHHSTAMHSPRNSVIFNPEPYVMNHAVPLPTSVYQRLHRQSVISLSATPSPRETMVRVGNLQEMRPFHLVGFSSPFCDWEAYRKPDEVLETIQNKEVREFYEKQNALIDRYMEIDRLLDSGLQIDMLREYGSDLAETHEVIQEEEEVPTGSSTESLTTVANGGSAIINHTTGGNGIRSGSGNSSTSKLKLTARQGVPGRIDQESPLVNNGQDRESQSQIVMFAIYVNLVINVFLLAGKIAVALLTDSLTIVASLVDSVLDFLSTAIIWVSTRLVERRDWRTKHLYPVGRTRLEPIGVLVFSILIIVSFLQVGDEAVQRLLWGQRIAVAIGIGSVAIMAVTVVAKVFCWLWCKTIDSSAVQALAQDALSDIVFNTFSIIMPLTGHYFDIWWLDPLGALLLSCYISWSWGETALEHIDHLTGAAAEPEDRQILLYLCARFAETIKQVTALNAYHSGDRLTVEVDIVLEPKSSLRDSHDIGEALQYALETVPFVERAFVHLDYREGNFTGHLER
ncbi:uncharacterized protein SAPINGB_P003963 [Magnusiomyces paraingens]|uniref:Uncharacterized protein n=1 Tax=Magnusiomyces paraingens TaxID=2606893 RepID=A0A5E8BS44_9ASCO|nr:uncharacterized protein SAPINGB_P003963 [Saprochaete ingens]VVT54213.1 unnamed protein product [Saprochaete ingens]